MTEKKRKEVSKDKRQYVITMICTLLAIELIVGSTFLSFYIIARKDAVAIGESSVSEQSERLNNFLLKSLDILDVTGTNVEYMMRNGAQGQEIVRYLACQTEDYAKKVDKDFTGIYGLFHGEFLDGTGWIPEEGYDAKTRPWYKAAVEANGEPVVVSPYLDVKTNRVMISVSRLLEDGESAISLDIAMDGMQEFAESINLKGSGYGFIVDVSGLVVAHADESEKGKNYLTDDSFQGTQTKEIIEKVIEGKGKTISVRIEGKDSRVFSKVVQDNWYVVMIVNVHDLFKEVEINLISCIIISSVLYVLVVHFVRASHKNKLKAMQYADELEQYQETLEERVEKQTKEIKEQTKRMVEIQESAVEGMATLIEGRDGNTGEHVRNTKRYVEMILRYMYANKMHQETITRSFVKKASLAATLHDVGKIKISDVILNKPGKFTPEEYAVMKLHATYGGDIVKEILGESADEELVRIAADVARYHHEKWDGTGYPEGLAGEEIPLCARIMAVADVFDALISKRVYKDAMSLDEAMRILEKDAGSHFDPEIVEVFLKLRPKVEAHYMMINNE